MLERMRARAVHHPVIVYFILAYALSWSICALLIADHNGLVTVPGGLHYLVSFGPALAALIVTALIGGRRGLSELLSRITRWRTRWLLVGLFSPLALAGSALLANYLLSGRWPDLAALGQVSYLGDIGVAAALLLWIATFGFGEEIGWRGFALHNLQQKQSPMRAALLIGVFWALCHLPEFFYKPNFIALGMGGFLGFAIGVIAGSVLLTWLYNRSGSSILVVALWHAVFDFTTATSAAEGTIAALTSVFVMVWAIVVGVMAIWRPNKGLLLPTAAVQANNGG